MLKKVLFGIGAAALAAVLVPDLAALKTELTKSDYDMVVINLSRGERMGTEALAAVKLHFASGPVLALLPHSARGDGNKYVGLGFDDFFYTPITRQNILAVIGKYLGFEPIAVPAD